VKRQSSQLAARKQHSWVRRYSIRETTENRNYSDFVLDTQESNWLLNFGKIKIWILGFICIKLM